MDYRSNSDGRARTMHDDKSNDEPSDKPLDLTTKRDVIEDNRINLNIAGDHRESSTFTEIPSSSNKSSYTSRSSKSGNSTLPWQPDNFTLPWQSDNSPLPWQSGNCRSRQSDSSRSRQSGGSNQSSNYSILWSYNSIRPISRSSIALQTFEMHKNNSNYISNFHKDQNKPKRKVPIEDQDDLYRKKRISNNLSAKRSRDKKKREYECLKERVKYFEYVIHLNKSSHGNKG